MAISQTIYIVAKITVDIEIFAAPDAHIRPVRLRQTIKSTKFDLTFAAQNRGLTAKTRHLLIRTSPTATNGEPVTQIDNHIIATNAIFNKTCILLAKNDLRRATLINSMP